MVTPEPIKGGLFLQSGTSYQELDEESYAHVISQDMAAALTASGTPCRTVNMLKPDDVELIAGAIVNPPEFLLTLNLMPHGFQLGGKHYVDLLSCKVFCLFLDSPIRLTELLTPGQFERLNEFYFGVLENSHAKFLEVFGVEQEKIFTFSHGGPPVDTTAPAFGDRDIDIMFSGGIGAAETPAVIFDQLNIHDQKIRTALEAGCESVLAGAGDIVTCADEALQEYGIESDALDRQAVLETLDGWTRTLRRHRLFATLKDLKINFYGNFHDSFKAVHPNSTFHDPVSYRRVIENSKTAKITLNDTINLMDSALFRFYYAIADGCLMATESNPFIAREFEDGRHAIHLDNRDPHNAEKITSALADTAHCEAMIEAAQNHYTKHHTWASRMPAVLDCLSKN